MKNDELLLDSSSKKRRQIYLFAFPLGAFFISTYIFINHQTLAPISNWIAAGISCVLLAFSVILFLRPYALKEIEVLFFFFLIVSIPAFASANLNNAVTISRSTPEYFSEVINGMTLWEVIFFIGAFLAISQKPFKVLVILAFVLIFATGTVNIILIQLSRRWELVYFFHWVHSLFALAVTIFLISRIGHLQKIYATTDPLTGILNRREALNILLAELNRAVRYNTCFSVMLIDIDHFKIVNDTFGHPIGDQVLKKFADTLLKSIREYDYLVRWGGEEFLVILPHVDLNNVRYIAERIHELTSNKTYGKVEKITASFGIAVYQPGQSLEDILSCVDQALYQAKREGRNRVIVFENKRFSNDG